jgi:hypothetical protein
MRAMTVPVSVEMPATLTATERAIAQSVLYAGLFDYPLTLAQLRQTLISCELTASEIVALYDRSPALSQIVERRDSYYFPAGRADLIAERRRREARSRHFLSRHRVLLTLICALPFVKMVALSGSIAHMNLEGSGDLDLFIVTRGRHVWSTAVGSVVLAKLLRRRATLCANYVIADSRLTFEDRDLFTASQIVHLKPLTGVDVYREMLRANPFVWRFYPNFHSTVATRAKGSRGLRGWIRRGMETLVAAPAWVVEAACRRLYGAYLKRRAATWRSPEQVRLEDDCLKLHTQSHRRSVLQRFDDATGSLAPRP